jgi:hypothetical protein
MSSCVKKKLTRSFIRSYQNNKSRSSDMINPVAGADVALMKVRINIFLNVHNGASIFWLCKRIGSSPETAC